MPVYAILYFVLFWIPVFILGYLVLPKVDPITRKAFWITFAILVVLTFAMEYLFLHFKVWDFSQQVYPLLGIDLFGVPIEEFEFWWGAAPLFMLLYLSFSHIMPKKVR